MPTTDHTWGPTMEVLWGLRASGTRGPKAAIGIAEIAVTAVRLADEAGVDAVTMSSVAARLGFSKMALYRHVPDKVALHAVMVERAIGEPPDLADVPGGWRGRATRWAELLWGTWDRHPWVAGLTTGERPVGPREVGWSVAALGCFLDLGLDRGQLVDAVALLSGHVRTTHTVAARGTQPWTADLTHEPALADVMGRAAVSLPALDALFAAPSAPGDRRSFGLRCILDGIEAQLSAGTPRSRRHR